MWKESLDCDFILQLLHQMGSGETHLCTRRSPQSQAELPEHGYQPLSQQDSGGPGVTRLAAAGSGARPCQVGLLSDFSITVKIPIYEQHQYHR